MPSLPDIDPNLVAKARTGNEYAIEQIYEKIYGKAYTTAYYFLGGNPRFKPYAEEIATKTFVNSLEKLHQLKNDDGYAPWFYVSLKHRCMDFEESKEFKNMTERHIHDLYEDYSSNEFRESYEESISNTNTEYNPNDALHQESVKHAVSECLQKLPDSQRDALVMFYFNGLTIKEISEAMDTKENSVKSLIHRGRQALGAEFEKFKKTDKSFYTVLPIPALLVALQEVAKKAPKMDGKKLASQIVIKIKANEVQPVKAKQDSTVHTQSKTSNTASTKNASNKQIPSSQNKAVHHAPINNSSAIASAGTKAKVFGTVLSASKYKLIAGIAAVVIAGTGTATYINHHLNESKNNATAQTAKQNNSNDQTMSKDGREWSITNLKKVAVATENYRYSEMQLYNSPFEDDPADGKLYISSLVGDSSTGGPKGRINAIIVNLVSMSDDSIPDKNGVYWGAFGDSEKGHEYYVKLQDKDNIYFDDNGDYTKSYTDYNVPDKFKKACGADLKSDIEIANQEIAEYGNTPDIEHGMYARFTQLCDGTIAYY